MVQVRTNTSRPPSKLEKGRSIHLGNLEDPGDNPRLQKPCLCQIRERQRRATPFFGERVALFFVDEAAFKLSKAEYGQRSARRICVSDPSRVLNSLIAS